ncbi:hypothetical protein D5018_06110 [Parashewanella curva]|uniref:Lipoprotein n=1 Tax=Parashewanella curva TaxID=2338552 RepID=A0A3L8Q131_9GAMM|nr:hypothetical protein [Parashewanella curva]RLV60518.1 hypothetical protein D5018_06110 [Parashewanella curva]
MPASFKNKIKIISALMLFGLIGCKSTPTTPIAPSFAEGKTVYSISNLHADPKGNRLFALNYQLPNLIPVCSKFVIKSTATKVIEVEHAGTNYKYFWDSHTRKAGETLQENFKAYFAPSCAAIKTHISELSSIDKKGIQRGTPIVGMSKEGVLIALGRPPIHANPNLDATSWTYWSNRWSRFIIEFNSKGEISEIIK